MLSVHSCKVFTTKSNAYHNWFYSRIWNNIICRLSTHPGKSHPYRNLRIQSIGLGELQWLHPDQIYYKKISCFHRSRNIRGTKDRSSPPLHLYPALNKIGWCISQGQSFLSQLQSSEGELFKQRNEQLSKHKSKKQN